VGSYAQPSLAALAPLAIVVSSHARSPTSAASTRRFIAPFLYTMMVEYSRGCSPEA
jgi:hypothetical protein